MDALRDHAPALGEPRPGLLVAVDARVLARLEHDVEVAAVDRLLRPPAVDDAPFLAHDRDRLAVDAHRRPVQRRLDQRRPRRIQSCYSSRGTNSARASGIRDHGATSTTAQTEPDPVLRTHLTQPFPEPPAELLAGGRDERELAAHVLGELDRLEPQLDDRRGDLGELRARAPRAGGLVCGRLAQRDGAAPGAAADEPRRERRLAQRPSCPLRPGEQPLEQRAERAPQRQLVCDRLREGERLGKLGGRAAAPHAPPAPAAGEPPGPPPSGPAAPRRLRPGAARARPAGAPRAPRARRSARPAAAAARAAAAPGSPAPSSSARSAPARARATLAAARAAKRRLRCARARVPGRVRRRRAPARAPPRRRRRAVRRPSSRT